jgi:hypothetical protein
VHTQRGFGGVLSDHLACRVWSTGDLLPSPKRKCSNKKIGKSGCASGNHSMLTNSLHCDGKTSLQQQGPRGINSLWSKPSRGSAVAGRSVGCQGATELWRKRASLEMRPGTEDHVSDVPQKGIPPRSIKVRCKWFELRTWSGLSVV